MTGSGRPWRCFVAVPLPEGLRQELRAWVDEARGDGTVEADWRWTDPDGWHVTLAFVGATPVAALAAIRERLAAGLVGRFGFSVRAEGVGAFPVRSRARVLWYGIRDTDRRLAELAQVVRVATGTNQAAPFRAHVTLARARDRHGTPLPSLPLEGLPAAEVPVNTVALMGSHLGRGPAHYEALAEFALLSATPAGASA